MNNFYTYIYYNPSRNNEPIYIGKGKKTRAWAHLKSKNKHPFIQRLQFMKNNNINPIIGIYADLEEELAHLLEEELIAKFGRKDLGKGPLLNLTDGGEGTSNLSLEIRQHLSKIKKDIPLPEQHRKNISIGNTGRIVSIETRQKISNSNKNKTMSKEAREKMSLAASRRIPWNKDKKGLQVAWNKGISTGPQTSETIEKKASARRGKPWSESRRRAQDDKK